MNPESRLQLIEKQLADIQSANFRRAGQLELPLDTLTQKLLTDWLRKNSVSSQAYPIGGVFISTVADDPYLEVITSTASSTLQPAFFLNFV